VRTLQDELPPAAPKLGRSAVETHRWGGLTNALEQSDDYRLLFKQVFGIARPTQDAVAKALATYMRTILAGDSLYDNAEEERRDRKASELTAAHFLPSLDAAALKSLGVEQESKQEVADRLGRGHRLFQAKGCAVCHPPPLFTDRDFHNVGIGESDAVPAAGAETGRFAHVPIGLKDARLIGAFKTPTLRGLPRTAPYFHTGSSRDLHSVVKYFDHSVPWNPSLAASLVGAGGTQARSLELSADDRRDLVLFLHALDGTPDPILAPPK